MFVVTIFGVNNNFLTILVAQASTRFQHTRYDSQTAVTVFIIFFHRRTRLPYEPSSPNGCRTGLHDVASGLSAE
jgi:hypothetical protein